MNLEKSGKTAASNQHYVIVFVMALEEKDLTAVSELIQQWKITVETIWAVKLKVYVSPRNCSQLKFCD